MSPTEQWRPIPGTTDYEVSNLGRVRSLRVLTGGTASAGYRVVKIHADTRYVHQLVAQAFVGPRPEGQEVRHLDGDMLNNAATNLAYGTRSDNMLDRVLHGTDRNAAKTECLRGHAFDEANTYIDSRGCRSCKTCRQHAQRRYQERRAFRAANVSGRAA